MAVGAFRVYNGTWLQPAIYPEMAFTDSVKFIPGTYVAGQVMAEQSNLTAGNDVQTITVVATGGTFKLQFNGDVTPDQPYNVTAANLKLALAALPSIGTGNVDVTGGPAATNPLVVTFIGQSAGLPQPVLIVAANALTGSPSIAVVHTTTGNAAGGIWGAYNDGGSGGLEIARGVNKFPLTVDNQGNHFAGGWEWGSRKLSSPVYIGGYFRTADLTGLDAAAIADLGRIVRGSASNLTNTGTILKIN